MARTVVAFVSSPMTGNIAIANNIIGDSIVRAVHIESGVSTSTLNFSHNNYDFGTGGEFLLFGIPYTLSGWRSATGLDAHSFIPNPAFVSSTPAAPSDFVLQLGSPAIGTGTTLASSLNLGLAPSSTWPASVFTTTQPTAWDVGASSFLSTVHSPIFKSHGFAHGPTWRRHTTRPLCP